MRQVTIYSKSMVKNLLSCPNCEVNGKKVILAEIDGNDILIKRFRNYYTRISGTNLRVRCNDCKEVVYIKADQGGVW